VWIRGITWLGFSIFTVFATCGKGWAVPEAALAQDDATRHGDWVVTCAKKDARTVCALSQKHFIKSSGRLAFALEFAMAKGNDNKRTGYLIARAPLETYLLSGVQLKLSAKQTLRLPFEFCNADGCIATLQAPEQVVNAMKRGSVATASFYTLNGKTISLPVSLSGFTAAHNDMLAKEAKQ